MRRVTSSRKKARKDPSYLPEPVRAAFLRQLCDLVDHVAEDGTFKSSWLRASLMSKFMDDQKVPPDVRRSAALDKWLHQETLNRKTNIRLYTCMDTDFGWASAEDVFAEARRLIADVLGPIANADLDRSRHTNGSSPRLTRSSYTGILKHTGKAQGTTSALLQWSLSQHGTILRDQEVEVHSSSTFFTVPKKSDIDRVACKEPEINLYLQKSAGDHIRSRMRRVGIDLNDQTTNQELARVAVEQRLATVDLSSASDSISSQLVLNLLPLEWYHYLDDIRVHHCDVDGEIIQLEMFSSMGNGFTFELESLIFWALTRSVCRLSGVRGTVKTYGDDIVAPSEIVPRLQRFFSFAGFRLNMEKSFWSGQFRESCGKHYHSTMDVTPFYVNGPLRDLTCLIRLLNRLMEWDSREWGFITDPLVYEFHYKWSQIVPRELWGGQDPNDITSLVTGSPPSKRLQRKSKDDLCGRPHLEEYRLLKWLNDAEDTEMPLRISASHEGRFDIVDQPDWLVRTTWTPWLAYT